VVATLSYMDNRTDNNKLMTIWCRMWNEDPSLAHDLMSDECVQWSDHTPGLDTVVGPSEQERFITTYRARHINAFTPRALFDAGDRFAYLWDVRTPDGRVLTGADFNILAGGRIHENWTFVGERRCDWPAGSAAEPVEASVIDGLCDRWVRFRNGESKLAGEVVTDDFAQFSGTGSGDLATTDIAVHRRPVVDLAHGRVAFLWSAQSGAKGTVGGVDFLTVRDGRFAQAWTLTGVRAFRY
jgi:hypothetical protein